MHLTECYYHVAYDFRNESTLYALPEWQGTPCSKQPLDLTFKSQQRDSNEQPLSSQGNTQPLSQTGEIIGLCCECLSMR